MLKLKRVAHSPRGSRRYPCRRSEIQFDPAAGKTFIHDGIQLYYEVYGTWEPLLLAHMNAGSIGNYTAQIDYFRRITR
jgi:hypothetical protein